MKEIVLLVHFTFVTQNVTTFVTQNITQKLDGMNKIIQLKVKTITTIQNNIDYCFKQTVTFNAPKKIFRLGKI